MRRITVCFLLVAFPFAIVAGEKVKGINFIVADNQTWPTGEGTGYWILHGKGIAHTIEGSIKTGSVECHGAGFWDQEGSWGEGVCVHADEEGTRTSTWWREKGAKVGQWKAVAGTGRFEGLSGEGTYTPKRLHDGSVVSEWEGEMAWKDQ